METRIRSLGLLTGALALLTAGGSAAETHLNQAPEEHVIVSFFGGMPNDSGCDDGQSAGVTGLYFERVLPNGQKVPFAIPADHYLVVTDFDLTTYVSTTSNSTASLTTILRLAPKGGYGTTVHRSSLHLTNHLTSKNFSLSRQSLAGIMVGANATLCPEIHLDDGTEGTRQIVTSGTYRGYLIPDSRARVDQREAEMKTNG